MSIRDFDARKDDDRERIVKATEAFRQNATYEWTCGHKAGAVCAECHLELVRKANALAAENLELREIVGALRHTIADLYIERDKALAERSA